MHRSLKSFVLIYVAARTVTLRWFRKRQLNLVITDLDFFALATFGFLEAVVQDEIHERIVAAKDSRQIPPAIDLEIHLLIHELLQLGRASLGHDPDWWDLIFEIWFDLRFDFEERLQFLMSDRDLTVDSEWYKESIGLCLSMEGSKHKSKRQGYKIEKNL